MAVCKPLTMRSFVRLAMQVATDAEGLSGRALRKLPFLAHAM